MQPNGWSFLRFSKGTSREILKAFDNFNYINGRLTSDDNLVNVPKVEITVILTNNKISALYLDEKFRGSKSHTLVCTQFLCALNVQLGGDLKMSYNAMGKFYHNLLMQALSKSGHKETVDFIKITDLVININNFL